MTTALVPACPVCGSTRARPGARVAAAGVGADDFRPSSDRFGSTLAAVVRCDRCGHGFLASQPSPTTVAEAYAQAGDPVSLREQRGQLATAHRALEAIERHVAPGRVCDLGCWTGSFLAAARDRGWDPVGVERSGWAAARAAERGLDVRVGGLLEHDLEAGSCRLVVMADVIEHLLDPAAGVRAAAALLGPGGAVFVTTPDGGSLVARALRGRWWSMVPMHLHWFTRASLRRLLERHGFEVVAVSTHPKAFTVRYYAERLGGYSAALGRAAVRVSEAAGVADRVVAPDFRDRMAVLARRV